MFANNAMKVQCKKAKIIVIALCFVGVGTAFLLFRGEKSEPPKTADVAENPAISETNGEETPGGIAQYYNDQYRFSFDHAADLAISEAEHREGTALLVQGGNGREFQIFITPWDEPMAVMTAERIRQDLPDIAIANPQEAVLENPAASAGQAPHALIFESEAAGVGKTREVWIIHNGSLYQITALFKFDGELAKIMETWRFEE